jgi:hypothetical protein
VEEDQRYQRLKFYFDGDSFTNGVGLESKEDYRWSKLVCDHFGAEEINLSHGGACNEKVMRHLFAKPTTEVYDFYFLQTTIPIRGEFYDRKKKRWVGYSHECGKHGNLLDKSISRWGRVEGPKFAQWIDFGLSRIYTDELGKTRESVAYHAMKAYVASIGRSDRSFFSTLLKPTQTDNKYDMYFRGTHDGEYEWPPGLFRYDKIPNDGHPSIEGHKTIAKYVIDIVRERLGDETGATNN